MNVGCYVVPLFELFDENRENECYTQLLIFILMHQGFHSLLFSLVHYANESLHKICSKKMQLGDHLHAFEHWHIFMSGHCMHACILYMHASIKARCKYSNIHQQLMNLNINLQ